MAYGSARLDERIEVGAFVRVDVGGDGDDEGVAGAEVGGVGRDGKAGGEGVRKLVPLQLIRRINTTGNAMGLFGIRIEPEDVIMLRERDGEGQAYLAQS